MAARWAELSDRCGPLKRLQRQGGHCDCEVLMNVYGHHEVDSVSDGDLPACPH